MNEAQETLRKHHVEIDAGDHRSAEEIVRALGLTASLSDASASQTTINSAEELKMRRPYFAG